jgi:glycosyltransferase involved in cell wall biosynthesis
MKVLQLGPYPPPNGGIQTHIVALREMLLGKSVSCDVMNLTRHRRQSGGGIFYPKNALEVFWLLLRRRYDILHLHIGGRVWPRQLALAIFCSLLPGRRTVLTFHSGGYPTSEEGRSTTPGSFRARVFRRFDRIIAVNGEIARFFARLGVAPERIREISPHSFLCDDLSRPTELPSIVEKFLADHEPKLITVGLLEKEYDLPLQIKTLGSVRETWPNAGLLIFGSGSLEQQLRSEIQQQLHAEHVLLYGDLEHAATLKAISRSTLMLRTTWYDGDALSVREALHLGVPVIATDNGMRPAGVKLIPARDEKALAQAIHEALTQPAAQPQPPGNSENGNLLAVLELYQELLS